MEASCCLTGMHLKKEKGNWVYLKSADVLAKAKLKTISQYMAKKRATVARAIESCQVLKECQGPVRTSWTLVRLRWWNQELTYLEEGANRASLGQWMGSNAGSGSNKRSRAEGGRSMMVTIAALKRKIC